MSRPPLLPSLLIFTTVCAATAVFPALRYCVVDAVHWSAEKIGVEIKAEPGSVFAPSHRAEFSASGGSSLSELKSEHGAGYNKVKIPEPKKRPRNKAGAEKAGEQ